jgi:hypothetical protein
MGCWFYTVVVPIETLLCIEAADKMDEQKTI